jgi:hypothetical protein
MTFGPPVSSDVTILDGTTTIGGNFGQFSLNNNTGPNFYPGFTFALNVASLVDYTGGPIIGTLFLNSANPSDNTGLVQGSLRVPEPASLVLLGSGFIGLAFLRSQRRAKR